MTHAQQLAPPADSADSADSGGGALSFEARARAAVAARRSRAADADANLVLRAVEGAARLQYQQEANAARQTKRQYASTLVGSG